MSRHQFVKERQVVIFVVEKYIALKNRPWARTFVIKENTQSLLSHIDERVDPLKHACRETYKIYKL